MITKTTAQKQTAYERHVERLFRVRDASAPGSPEEEAAAAKILEAMFRGGLPDRCSRPTD